MAADEPKVIFMRYFTLIFLLFTITSTSYCQFKDATISGSVLNRESEPVPNATVTLLNSRFRTTTNNQGKFSLEGIPAGTYILNVRRPPYSEFTQRIRVRNEDQLLSIVLSPETESLGEVVISAQKREELIQEIPLSITSLSSQTVEESQTYELNDITAVAPNLFARDPGDQRSVVSIRGIISTSYDPAIATYIDGVNQFGLDINIPLLFDIERIEVLRGPQGTLYGRNAMGGVVNIITRQPERETSIFGEVTAGNYGRQKFTLGFRVPLLSEKLYLGAVGSFQKIDGFYTNTFSGQGYDEQQSLSGNYYLKYLINPFWEATLNFKHANLRNEGPFPLVMGIEEAFENPYLLNQNQSTELFDHSFNTSLVIAHRGNRLNFISQSSFQQNYHYYEDPIDADFSPLDAISIYNNYGTDWNQLQVFTQDIRFSSPARVNEKFNWAAGSFLFHSRNPVRQSTQFGQDAAIMGSEETNFELINTGNLVATGMAVYGQSTYMLNDRLGITAGLRYDYEHKEQSIHGEYNSLSEEVSFEFQADSTARASFNAISPMAGFTYDLSEDHLAFLTYRRGFRTGGFTPLSSDPSQPPLHPFNPEHSNNYEVGIKTTFLDNRIKLNTTLFYTEVTDVQVPTLILPDAVTLTRNTGSMISKGGELELGALPLRGIQLTYNLGITDAAYKSLQLSQEGEVINYGENQQIFTPDVTSMLSLKYETSLGKSKENRLFVRGEWKYLGEHYFDLANTLRQDPYHLFNSQIGFSRKKWKLSLWGRNLFDQRYISYGFDFGAVHLGDPATFGVSLSFKT